MDSGQHLYIFFSLFLHHVVFEGSTDLHGNKLLLPFFTLGSSKGLWSSLQSHRVPPNILGGDHKQHGRGLVGGVGGVTLHWYNSTFDGEKSVYLHLVLFRTIYYYQAAVWFIRPYFRRYVTLIVNLMSQYKSTPQLTDFLWTLRHNDCVNASFFFFLKSYSSRGLGCKITI
jgi:hypothetical protein